MVEVRRARPGDIEEILRMQVDCYPVLADYSRWDAHHLESHQRVFPPGQFVAVDEGRLVGFTASFLTTRHRALAPHTFREITAAGTFSSHDPDGDTLYGAEMMLLPSHRGQGVSRWFYQRRFELMAELGIRHFVAGGRIPGYAAVKDQVTADQYVADVVEGRRVDRVLTTQLRNGLRVVRTMPNYLRDPSSADYAVLLHWVDETPEGAGALQGVADRVSNPSALSGRLLGQAGVLAIR